MKPPNKGIYSILNLNLLFLITLFLPLTMHGQNVNNTTFVIVHGAWGGSWAFKNVDSLLTRQGHLVYRPSLTGQGERAHLASPDIGLETHINDVVNMILYENLDDIVLVGHSYGGMVITGAADRVADRIRKLIYLDAFLPNDGESVFNARPGGNDGMRNMEKDGMIVPAWVSADQKPPKDVPQSAKTFSDPISLKNEASGKIPAVYILTVDEGKKPEEDGFYFFAERAKERGWKTINMIADHNPQWSKPNELVRLLLENK